MKEIIQALQNGEIIIVTDDKTRENEADMICAVEHLTAENIRIMATYARGLICTPISQEIAEAFDLTPMVSKNTDNHQTAFTVSIDHVNTGTGISALERAETMRALLSDASPKVFRRPGHVFPLIAKSGGVLERKGHTEATVDLMKMAGLSACGVCCEIMDDDGTMMTGNKVALFAEKMGMKMTTVEAIRRYRIRHESHIERVVESILPSKFGTFRMIGFYDRLFDKEHLALVKGDMETQDPVLCRVHSECLTGDALGSLRCDCGNQLEMALRAIEQKGRGVVLYMRQEGRGIGLLNKLKAYRLQDKGLDTVDANLELGFEEDERDYITASQILLDLNVKEIDLMTNNPDKIDSLEEYGIRIRRRVPIEVHSTGADKKYLETKVKRMNHLLQEFR